MIPVTQLRAGRTFRLDGEPYQVLEYKHKVMGRGQATIRVRAKNLKSGEVTEKVFNSGAKVNSLETETRLLKYLYQDEARAYFIDPQTFEQFSLARKIFGSKIKFLKEGSEAKILFGVLKADQEKEPFSFELPHSMVLTVSKASPGVKGDTVSGATKPATMDNGLVVNVPLFIRVGDKIKVDTKSGEYISRVS